MFVSSPKASSPKAGKEADRSDSPTGTEADYDKDRDSAGCPFFPSLGVIRHLSLSPEP